MKDILIGGGIIAGSALAVLLGRLGHRVEIFEKADFPRDKACGEGLMPAGVAVLKRMGLIPQVRGMPFRGVRYHVGERSVEGTFPPVGGKRSDGLALRRTDLDRALFPTAASTPGVTAHCGTRVDDAIVRNGRVVGLMAEGGTWSAAAENTWENAASRYMICRRLPGNH
jgi:2-polyprenyl-6-methoxyphenol hydroxylase-like FAD-dependent oxidoreductase